MLREIGFEVARAGADTCSVVWYPQRPLERARPLAVVMKF
jgi:hypothetical protein